jgi:hypothetical protein
MPRLFPTIRDWQGSGPFLRRSIQTLVDRRIDPELMIRMLIIGYVFAISSERPLGRDVQVNPRRSRQIEGDDRRALPGTRYSARACTCKLQAGNRASHAA